MVVFRRSPDEGVRIAEPRAEDKEHRNVRLGRTAGRGAAWHGMAWPKPSSSLMLRLVVHAINRIGHLVILAVYRNAPSLCLGVVYGGWNGDCVLAYWRWDLLTQSTLNGLLLSDIFNLTL
jgi:hypothetical protein